MEVSTEANLGWLITQRRSRPGERDKTETYKGVQAVLGSPLLSEQVFTQSLVERTGQLASKTRLRHRRKPLRLDEESSQAVTGCQGCHFREIPHPIRYPALMLALS